MFCFCQSAAIHDRFTTYPAGKTRHVTRLGKSDLLLSRNAVFNGLSKLLKRGSIRASSCQGYLAGLPSYSSSDRQCQDPLNLPIAGTAMSCSQKFAVIDGFSKMPDAVTATSCFHEVPSSTDVRTAEVKAGLPLCCRHHVAHQHRPKCRRDGFR